MKNTFYTLLIFSFLVFSNALFGQQENNKKIGFYGGFGLSLSTGFTYISLQPGIIYHLHPKYRMGAGIQYTYLKSNKTYYGVNYSYNIFGFNVMNMYYPAKELEISVEFEDLYVNQKYNDVRHKFWSPSLFGGMGYRYGQVVAGFKFNFLFDREKSIYQDAFIPFIRVYF